MAHLQGVSNNNYTVSRPIFAYSSDIISENPADVLEALSLVCHAVDRVGSIKSVNCCALGDGLELVGGGLSLVGAIGNGLKTIELSVSSDFSARSVIDLSESAARTVRDSAKTFSFFEAVGAIQQAPLCTKIVAETASVVASIIGFGNNIDELLKPIGSNACKNNAHWWKNATEAGANSLGVALSVITLLGVVLAEVFTLVLATALLVCVFASHVFTKDLEQIESINHLHV